MRARRMAIVLAVTGGLGWLTHVADAALTRNRLASNKLASNKLASKGARKYREVITAHVSP